MLKTEFQFENDSLFQSLDFRESASLVSGGALAPEMPAFVTRGKSQWGFGSKAGSRLRKGKGEELDRW